MQGNQRHFIVVDDDKDMRYLVRRVILRQFSRGTGHRGGQTGCEALRLFEHHGADLMIVDHNLPNLDGAELIRELRAREVKIPLVMMSNFAAVSDLAMAARSATSFVDKGKIHPCLGDYLPDVIQGGNEPAGRRVNG